ncbi:MAG TPA: hypothetical protein VEY88_08260 [Archangium sp.]|nr:hypothetical protein [Archangium sp.]
MRRWSLVLLLATASPVFAQEAQEAPAAPAPEPQAAEPVPAAPAPAAEPSAAPAAPAAEKPARGPRTPSPEAPAPAPAAPAPVVQAPAPSPSAVRQDTPAGSIQDEVRDEARYLLSYLLTGDVRSTLQMLSFPFQLEERSFDTPEALVVTWVKQLRQKRTDLVTLYDIEVLSYGDMEKKYGKPPARLGALATRGEVYAAVANLSGRAAVILYRREGVSWKAFAYTD